MPRYFFHSEDGHRLTDEEGSELPDLAAAKRAAARLLGEILSGDPSHFMDTEVFRLFVTDEQGTTLYMIQMLAVERPDASGGAWAASQAPSAAEGQPQAQAKARRPF
jgi:hypothetical protein